MIATLLYKTKLTLATFVIMILSCSFKFSHFSLNEGLSHSIVVSCCQDSLGHMWFATHDGLNRYDGYRFTVYKNDQQDSTSIADNLIRKVYTDSKGGLWKEACRLLKDGRYSISEISDMVGFNTPSYFATCFKKYMGCLPTEYVKNLK